MYIQNGHRPKHAILACQHDSWHMEQDRTQCPCPGKPNSPPSAPETGHEQYNELFQPQFSLSPPSAPYKATLRTWSLCMRCSFLTWHFSASNCKRNALTSSIADAF